MSHTVTVTRTTTTTSTSAIILNTGYMKTFPGLLKLLETVIAGICLFIITYFDHYYYVRLVPYEFFLAVMTLALVASFCLLLSCLISLSTSSIIAKTSYELVYHLVAFALTLAASITLLIEVQNRNRNSESYNKFMAASVLGIVLAILYFLSTVLAFRSYRGL